MNSYTQEQWEFIKKIQANSSGHKRRETPKEDLSLNKYFDKYGKITSTIDGKDYYSKQSYLDHVKANNCEIKDW